MGPCWIPAIAQSGRNFGNIFYFFVPRTQSNKDNKTLQAQILLITIKLLPYTVLLNLKIVCHLAELNSIKNDSKTIRLVS